MIPPFQRALRFKFLSHAFAWPNEAFLPVLTEVSEKIENDRQRFQTLIEAFRNEDREALQAEYTRLFLNGYPHTVCPPYESVYLEKRVHGESTVAVQAAYNEWSMTVQPGLIDHISTELEFLAFLASAESLDHAISKEAKTASGSFLQQHLLRWTPQFIADLKAGAQIESYRLLGELMEYVLAGGCGKVWPCNE